MMGRLFRSALIILMLAAVAHIACVQALKPTSVGAFLFWATWLVAPVVMAGTALIFAKRAGQSKAHWNLTAILMAVSGVLYLADVIFLRPDAQGAVAVLMAPILQTGVALLLLPTLRWLLR